MPLPWWTVVCTSAVAVTFAWYAAWRTKQSECSALASLMAHRKTIVLFGDSLTQRSFQHMGWGAGIADMYTRKADVINRGFGGYNTRWASLLLPRLFPIQRGRKHSIVTCFFGANDAAAEEESPHVPLHEYKTNLLAIVAHLKQVSEHVILISPPPVHEPGRLAFQKEKYGDKASGILERSNMRVLPYVQACKAAAEETGVPFVDLYSSVLDQPQWETMFVDGLHFTEKGQLFVFGQISRVMEQLLSVESLSLDFPWGQKMDRHNPAKSIVDHLAQHKD